MSQKLNFRSGFEKTIYANNPDLEYEPESPRVGYTIPYRYIPDFRLPNGILVEAKGYLRPRDRTKMRKVKEQNPDLDIRFLFQRANTKLTKSKNSEMYWQWAERLGFEWHEGTKIPEEWYCE